MAPFIYEGLPARVVFAAGARASLRDEVERLGCRRALVLSTPQQAETVDAISESLGELRVGLFTNATMHTPVDVTEDAVGIVAECKADAVVAIGGGSTIGLGKAIALRTDLPQVVMPTTYAGSEMTPILGQTESGVKTTQRTPKVLPETVIYDVELTTSLPPLMSVTSGLNAMAHAVEALYASNSNPIIAMMAESGIAALYAGLPKVARVPDNIDARADALYGAWLCAICLGVSQIALHHKLCHVLGGSFDLPHAETHAIILPHAIAYNAPAAREAMAALKRALGGEGVAGRIYDVAAEAGAATALKDIGMPEDGIDRVVDLVLASPYANPRPIERELLSRLMRNAWQGTRPDHSSYAG